MEERAATPKRDATLGTSQDRPAPVGTTIKTKLERGDRYSAPEVYSLEITLLETIRGEEAWRRVSAEGITHEPPRSGFEYLLVRARFGYFSKGRGFGHEKEPYTIEPDYFVSVAADGGTPLKVPALQRQPEPPLIGVPFSPGDTKEGWIVLQVEEAETNPLIIFKREYRENTYGMWGPVWFQL